MQSVGLAVHFSAPVSQCEANLSGNQIGGGTQGREVLFTCPIKMSVNPPILQQ